jgi:hypothetical protein
VFANARPVVRVGDPGVHAACCGPNTWVAQVGSTGVFVNGIAVHRLGDADKHCGGVGKMVEGSPDVYAGGGSGAIVPSEIVEGLGDKFVAVFRDAEGAPISYLPVVVTLPTGELRKMRTDKDGRVVVRGIDPGQCKVEATGAWIEKDG